MNTPLILGLSAVGLLVLVGVIWRLASRRQSLPCPAWLGWMVELDNPLARSNRSANIVERLAVQPGMKALDIGCGPGRVTVPLAKKVGPSGQVVAIDMQPGMLKRAQEKTQTAGLENITFREMGIGLGKLDETDVDRAVLVTVLGEIPDCQAALEEIFHALKPGGLLQITETVFDPHYQRYQRVLQWATQAGFREKECFGNWLAYNLNLEKPTETGDDNV